MNGRGVLKQTNKNDPLLRRAGYAMQGFVTAFRSELAFRQQALASALVLGLMAVVQPALVWWALIVLALCAALATELLNAAIEAVCDRLHPERHPLIGAAKDLASAAVFLMNCALGVLILLMLASRFLPFGP